VVDSTILVSVIGVIGASISAVILYKKDIKLKELDLNLKNVKSHSKETDIKIGVLDSLLKMSVFSQISDSVGELFLETRAERFMIFIAVNGKTDFNVVSVIFERYKELRGRVNALARYHNVHIDPMYRRMLKDVERERFLELDVDSMPEQLLKSIYDNERIKHSVISFIKRSKIDEDAELVVFCSTATTIPFKFTDIELMNIKALVEGTLQPNL